MTTGGGFERIGFAATEHTARRIDRACERDNIHRAEWVRVVIEDALRRSERGERIVTPEGESK